MNLSKNTKISSAVTPTAGAAAQSAIEGTILDMSGYEGVLVIVRMGAITAGAATSIKMQQGAAAAMGDAADLEGTSQTVGDGDDGEIFYIDLYKPTERYVRLYVSRGTQDAAVASAEYIQYGPKAAPVTQPTGTNGETHVSPAEGTA
jgi:hypothetical protein